MTTEAHPDAPSPEHSLQLGATSSTPVRAEVVDGGVGRVREGVGKILSVTGYVVVFGVTNLALLIIAPEGLPFLRLLFASALLWVATWPFFHFMRNRLREIPIVPAISILYFLYFGLPVFTGSVLVRMRTYEAEEVTTAVALTLAGLVLLQVAFYSPIGKVIDLVPNLSLKFDLERLAWYFAVMAIAGIAASAAIISSSRDLAPAYRAVANIVIRIPLLMLSGLFLLHLRGKLSLPLRVVGVLTSLAYLLLSLATGALAPVASALAPFFFIYMAERSRLPWRAGVLCFLLAMPFLASKSEFRQELRRSPIGPVDRITLFLGITYEQVATQGHRYAEVASKTTSERTSYLGTFAYVVNQTPRRVPYLVGDTYTVALWSFVPRVFAPERPAQSLGQDFGHRYRLLNPTDHATSFNCAQIIEMYMNFGPTGVLVGMFLVGLYYRALYALFNHDEGGDGMLLIAATAMTGLLNIESDAANVLVGGFQGSLFFYVLFGALMFAVNNLLIVRPEE
ncbi:MAG: hypothetical protein FJ096_00500 [Deltaproteobacteria bacterium]|nr:hypothetical protein [Deltaproteobacteria bacterium]